MLYHQLNKNSIRYERIKEKKGKLWRTGQEVFQTSFSSPVCLSSKEMCARQFGVSTGFESTYCSKANFNL